MSATATKRPEMVPGLPLSYAARLGGTLHVELELPKAADGLRDGARLRARSKGRVLTAEARVVDRAGVAVISADLPATELAPGSWRLQLSAAESRAFQPVRAFVLVPADGPIALLFGEPEPAQTAPRRTRRLGTLAGSVLDAAVAQLDPDTADRTRTRLRQLARRLPI